MPQCYFDGLYNGAGNVGLGVSRHTFVSYYCSKVPTKVPCIRRRADAFNEEMMKKVF